MNQTFLEGGKDPRSQLSLVLNTVTVARDLKINWVKKKKTHTMKQTSQFEVTYIRCFSSPLPREHSRTCLQRHPWRGRPSGTEAAPWHLVSTPLSEF